MSTSLHRPAADDAGLNLDEQVRLARQGNAEARRELENSVRSALRWFFSRNQTAPNREDRVLQIAGAVLEAVTAGRLNSAREVSAFTLSAARAALDLSEPGCRPAGPLRAQVNRMKAALGEFSPLEREALTRYHEGQPVERICSELDLSVSELDRCKELLRSRYGVQTGDPAGRLASLIPLRHA